MITVHRALSYVTGALVLLAFELLIAYPTAWPIILPMLVIALGVGTAALVRFRTDNSFFWEQLGSSMLFLASAVFLLFFLSESWLIQTIALSASFAVWWHLENIFLFLHVPERYQAFALENLGYLSAIATVFLFVSGLAAARIYLSIPLLTICIIAAVFAAIHAEHVVRIGKVPPTRRWAFFVPISFIIAEVVIAVILLPTSFFVAGLLAAIPAYLMVNLVRHTMAVTVTKQVVRRYAVIAGSALAVTLLTAPWI